MLLADGNGPVVLEPTPTPDILEGLSTTTEATPTPYDLILPEEEKTSGVAVWLIVILALLVIGAMYVKRIYEKVAKKRE